MVRIEKNEAVWTIIHSRFDEARNAMDPDSAEALAIGACERPVRCGQARLEAEKLAAEIARFPQACVRADRRSIYMQHGETVRDAMRKEWYNGLDCLVQEGVGGAGRFKDGLGRHGDFSSI